MKSKVISISVECRAGEEPEVSFHRYTPGSAPVDDWWQPHKISTMSSARRLERVMEGGEPQIAGPTPVPGGYLPGHVRIYKETDPEFWAAHEASLREIEAAVAKRGSAMRQRDTLFYIEDEGQPPRPVGMEEWATVKGTADWRVALDDLGERGSVSTVFLGVDHRFVEDDGPPLLYETLVFDENDATEEAYHYATRHEALEGHAAVVKRLTESSMRIRYWFDDTAALDEFREKRVREGGNRKQIDVYLYNLIRHIRYVQEAGRMLAVPAEQLAIHDASKFSDIEFLAAAEQFHGGAPNPDRYARGWLHHIHHNPHHWQHWIFPDGFVPKGTAVEAGVMEMPQRYALEMVADWMGSSMAYTGSWDMTRWLTENMGRIHLHSRTAAYVREVLVTLGYPGEIVGLPWAHE